jgi:hypothetical protein
VKQPYLCKEFVCADKKSKDPDMRRDHWKVLGTVYAHTTREAWLLAHKNWKCVDSVYELYFSD